MKIARPDSGRADQHDENSLPDYRCSSQRKIPFVNFIERNFALVDGLEVVQYRDVSQIYPPYCVLPYRVMDKIVHYSKMSKTRKKPRKSFHERWEHSQKRVGSATCWGNDDWQSVRFSDRPGTRHFIAPHLGLLRFAADAYNQPSEFRMLALRPFCRRPRGNAPCA